MIINIVTMKHLTLSLNAIFISSCKIHETENDIS